MNGLEEKGTRRGIELECTTSEQKGGKCLCYFKVSIMRELMIFFLMYTDPREENNSTFCACFIMKYEH